MCGPKLTLLLSISAFSIINTYCESVLLKPYRRDITLKYVLHDVISQNRLRGFYILNAINYKVPKAIELKMKDIIQLTVQLTTVTCMHFKNIEHERFLQNVTRFYRSKKLTFRGYLMKGNLAANDNTYCIVIVHCRQLTYLHKILLVAQCIIPSAQSVTQMLVVALVHRKYSKYKSSLELCSTENVYNVDVLEIKVNAKRSVEGNEYRVLQYEPFKKLFRAQKYRRGLKFFPTNSDINLYGHEILVKTALTKRKPAKKYEFSEVYILRYYPLEAAIKQLNASCRFLLKGEKSKTRAYMYATLTTVMPNLFEAFIAPPIPRVAYFMAPTFYDTIDQGNFDVWFACLVGICWSITVFWMWARFYRFDRLTWDPFMIFSMIIGVGNPRGPVRPGEYVTFMTVISVGFFFGSDLIFGLTSLSIVRKVERGIETIEDFRANNITIGYSVIPDFNTWTWERMKSLRIKYFKMEVSNFHRSHRKYLKQMYHFKNVSLTTLFFSDFGSAPQILKLDNVVYARLSGIVETYLSMWWTMNRNQPWFHDLNYKYMRFHESYLSSLPEQTLYVHKGYWMTYINSMRELREQLDLEKHEESEMAIINGLLWIYVMSCFLSFVLLVLEVKLIVK